MKNLLFLLALTILFRDTLSAQELNNFKETKKLHQNSTEQESQINAIDSLMTKSYERGLFNGNVLVVKNNTVIYQKSFGFVDETKQTPLNNKSIFNIGSIAKEFNAVAIIMLEERGLLNLDDPISKFNLGLPKWAEKVTTRHLINYASGISKIESKLTFPKNDEEAWQILKNSDSLLFEPGNGYMYDNGNVFLQRRIIEKVTGETYQEFVTKNIIQPLKMNNSVFDPKLGYKNRTSCYDLDNIRCPELEFISGWLWVDINDLYKWIDAMNNNRLISKESFQTLLNNLYAKEEGASLGRYFEKEDLQRHNGVSYKFESIFLNDFKNNITIILLSNNLNRVWDLGHIIHNLMLGKDYDIPKKSIYQALRNVALADANKAIATYYLLKQNTQNEYSFNNPNELNKLGYELLKANKISEAIKIFTLATTEFPKDANVFDSLGEAYFNNKEFALSKQNYQKSLELNTENKNAKDMLLKIEKEVKK